MVSDLLMSYSESVNQTLRQENKIDMSYGNDQPHLNERCRGKFIAFMISEASALGVLLPSLGFGLLRRFSNPTLALSMNVLTIAAAAAVAIIPIIFYATARTIPRSER